MGAARVLGGELNFRTMLPRVAHVRGDRFESLPARHAEFVLQMQIRSCENNVHARMNRILKAVKDYIDIVSLSACQRRHRAIADFARYGTHAFQISTGSDRETGLNDVHPE